MTVAVWSRDLVNMVSQFVRILIQSQYVLFYLIHNIGNNKWISVVVVFLLFINVHKFLFVILESSPFVNLYTRTSNSRTKYLYFKYANAFLVVLSRNHKLSDRSLTTIKSLGFLSFLLFYINRLFKNKSIPFQNLVGVLVFVTFQLQHWFLLISHACNIKILHDRHAIFTTSLLINYF